jgi:GrpB-like predicted nucleotidyltransferase (UPF0157 family)
MCGVDALTDAGLGLGYHELRLDRTTEGWVAAGSSLGEQVAAIVVDDAANVEQIGSSSVVGLLAKPIVDLAVGLSEHHDLGAVRERLEVAGWIYRGDAGNHGSHVFVLEARPWHRVAHLHVVDHGSTQWRNYLVLRDLLRRSSDARDQYEAVKLRLVEAFGDDRKAYTDGKSDIVRSLIREPE